MDSIIINSHNNKKLNIVYNQLKKQYPTFKIVKNNIKNEHPVISAMRKMQKEMEGKFEEAGLNTEEDIINLVREVRAEVEGL